MKTSEKEKKKDANAGSDPPRSRNMFVCIDPAQRATVFDFFKGFYKDQKQMVLIHLRLCMHCQEAVTKMLKLDEYLDSENDDYFHEKKVHEVAADDEKLSCPAGGEKEDIYAQACGREEEPDFCNSNPSLS